MSARFLWLILLSIHAAMAADLEKRTWVIDGVEREAWVRAPAMAATENSAAPLIFIFHGHGGTMASAARSMPFHALWPEALVVYPQGLPTPGALTDPEGKRAGWQSKDGEQRNRDLKFFDTMLADLRKNYRVDERRIYASGHSNGGSFTYLLGIERRDVLAAIGPSSSVLGRNALRFKPIPVIHVAGTRDPLVKFAWQERNLNYVLKINAGGTFKSDALGYTAYPAKEGTDTAVYLHAGGHEYPAAATGFIVKFFQAHARP